MSPKYAQRETFRPAVPRDRHRGSVEQECCTPARHVDIALPSSLLLFGTIWGGICFADIPVCPGRHVQLKEALIWNVLEPLPAHFELFSPDHPPAITHKITSQKTQLHSWHFVSVAHDLHPEAAGCGCQGPHRRGSMNFTSHAAGKSLESETFCVWKTVS